MPAWSRSRPVFLGSSSMARAAVSTALCQSPFLRAAPAICRMRSVSPGIPRSAITYCSSARSKSPNAIA